MVFPERVTGICLLILSDIRLQLLLRQGRAACRGPGVQGPGKLRTPLAPAPGCVYPSSR
jgi:hypothetical protein